MRSQETVPVSGLCFREEILGHSEEEIILGKLAGLKLVPFRFQSFTGKRLTRSFGWRYDFQRRCFEEAEPIPRWLLGLRERAAGFARLAPEELAQLLVTRYDPGAGIGWHRDRPVFEDIIGISLAGSATMNFRQRTPTGFRRFKLNLPPRSAYHLSGEARHDWEHAISPHKELRFSLTFRGLSRRAPQNRSAPRQASGQRSTR